MCDYLVLAVTTYSHDDVMISGHQEAQTAEITWKSYSRIHKLSTQGHINGCSTN